MVTENQNQEKPIEVKIKNSEVIVKSSTAIIAIVISIFSFFLSVFSIVRPFDKAEIIVTSRNEMNFMRTFDGLTASQDIILRNVGKKTGVIASVEGLIVSIENEKDGNPIFKKYFDKVDYFFLETAYEGKYSLLNWIVAPNEWCHFYINVIENQRNR